MISPLVRRLAREAGVDLRTVTPGPTGVIRKADLAAYLGAGDQPQETPGGAQQQPQETLGGTQEQPFETPGGRGGAGAGATGDTRIPIRGVHRIMVDRLSTSRREIPDATTWVDVDATGLLQARDALRRTRPDAGIGLLALLARITVAGLAAYPALNLSLIHI